MNQSYLLAVGENVTLLHEAGRRQVIGPVSGSWVQEFVKMATGHSNLEVLSGLTVVICSSHCLKIRYKIKEGKRYY